MKELFIKYFKDASSYQSIDPTCFNLTEYTETWLINNKGGLNKHIVTPRYFVDIRCGCGAVRDKWHESYDEDYQGLHSDTPDVVEYKQGYTDNGVWNIKDEDVKYLNDLCDRLNNQLKP